MIRLTLPGEPIPKVRPRITKNGAYDPQRKLKEATRCLAKTHSNDFCEVFS